MSATKELVSYVKEYTEFLEFVNKTNPEILLKWKNRIAGARTPAAPDNRTTDDTLANDGGDTRY